MRCIGIIFLVAAATFPARPSAAECVRPIYSSFEDATRWSWKKEAAGWHGFQMTSTFAHSGIYSALTGPLQNEEEAGGAHIWGAVQALPVSKLPRKLSLWYRVENWRQAMARQYIQVVLMVHDERLRKLMVQPHMQLRYILGGISKAPYGDPVNGRFLMRGPRKPKQGAWIHFETDPLRDFIESWGWFPDNFQKMEIFLEARYDDPVPKEKKVSGEVYWDDLEICD